MGRINIQTNEVKRMFIILNLRQIVLECHHTVNDEMPLITCRIIRNQFELLGILLVIQQA
jgi:hypothetical protein